ncbi:MAG: hypothetical protein JRJ77_11115 [Deltaproteobacteria bacterium]|nr:hypothetical protein [Deltaproteobacteria bacterium]
MAKAEITQCDKKGGTKISSIRSSPKARKPYTKALRAEEKGVIVKPVKLLNASKKREVVRILFAVEEG